MAFQPAEVEYQWFSPRDLVSQAMSKADATETSTETSMVGMFATMFEKK